MKNHEILVLDSELTFPHIFAIDASAGAGKTHWLTQRYLQLILSRKIKNAHFKHIAAITFTNRAANEMKARIIKTLKKLALKELEEQMRLSRIVNAESEYISEKALEYVEEMIKNYSELNIGTIDSFLNSIIRASAIESSVSPDFEITAEQELYVEYAIDRLLERIHSEPAVEGAFKNFIQSYLTLEMGRSWNPKAMIMNKINIMREMENTFGMPFKMPQEESNINPTNIVHVLERFLKHCERLTLKLHGNAQKAIEKYIQDKSSNSEYLNKEDVTALFNKTDKDKITPELKELWSKFRGLMDEFNYFKAEKISEPYIRILGMNNEELLKVKRERGLIFIDEINRIVNDLVRDFQVPYLYFKLGETIFHYIIDEFQDTNEIQWENIRELVHNSLSQGGSLFYVGDRKQAIYRFRGGRAELFNEVLNDTELTSVLTNKSPYHSVIRDNWRSREEIINFNNRVFMLENLRNLVPKSESALLNSTYCDTTTTQTLPESIKDKRMGGYVYVRTFREGTNKKEIDEKIKSELMPVLKKILLRRNAGDIAILVPENKDVRTITGWLGEEKISVISEISSDLRNHPLIREILSLMNFLNSPVDNLSFASFITGEIFLKKTGLKREEVLDWLNWQNTPYTVLYTRFREWEKAKDFWEHLIGEFLKRAGFLTPYDLVVKFIDRYEVINNFKDSEGFFIHLLELMKNREGAGENSLNAFLNLVKSKDWNSGEFLVRTVTSRDAITVMTIHKAKGLEFHVVILPFAGIDIKVRNELVVNDGDSIKIIYQKEELRKHSQKLTEFYLAEKEGSLIDRINLLYVACTRAKDELYLFVPPKVGAGNNLLLNIQPFNSIQNTYSIGEADISGTKTEDQPSHRLTLFKNPVRHDWEQRIAGLKSIGELKKLKKLSESTSIKKGLAVHRALSSIGNITPENENNIISDAVDLAISETGFPSRKEIESSLMGLLSMPSVKRWFYLSGDKKVFREKEMIAKGGELLRPDRIIITDDLVEIIDFKTGGKENLSHDRRQVRNYMESIKEMYPEKRVHGYIIYLDGKEIIGLKDEE